MAATILRLTIMLSLIGTELCQIRSAGQAFRPFLFPSQIEQWHLDEISAGEPMPWRAPDRRSRPRLLAMATNGPSRSARRQATAPQRHGSVAAPSAGCLSGRHRSLQAAAHVSELRAYVHALRPAISSSCT